MKNKSKVFILYVDRENIVRPINCQFSYFFVGVDEIAVFDNPETVAAAIHQLKQEKKNWGIDKKGKFHIVNINRNKFPITLNQYNYGAGLAHDHKGKIWRVPIATINGMTADEWYKKLKNKKQISLH